MEAVGYAVGCDFDRVGVFGLQRAVFEGSLEEVNDGEREAFAGVGRLCIMLVVLYRLTGIA